MYKVYFPFKYERKHSVETLKAWGKKSFEVSLDSLSNSIIRAKNVSLGIQMLPLLTSSTYNRLLAQPIYHPAPVCKGAFVQRCIIPSENKNNPKLTYV